MRKTAGGNPWQWYDRPMPEDWGLTPEEWDWFCFRSKGTKKEPDPGKKNDTKAGATAGWRR